MPKKVLGLDIGRETVKAVTVAAGLKKGYRICAWETVDIRESGSLFQAIQKLFENREFRGCPCVTSLPARSFFFRNVRLPFKEKQKIRQTLPSELEAQIPQAIEDVLIDFIGFDRDEGSDIFAAAIPKAVVQERLELLSQFPAPISALDVDTVPLAAKIAKAAASTGFHVLLDIGEKDSVGVFLRNGRLAQVRAFAFGGGSVTEALASALGVPLPEAERVKRRGDLRGAEESVSQACRRFSADVKNTVESLRMLGDAGEALSRISLTGGGALCSRIQTELSAYFGLPVDFVDLAAMEGMPFEGGRDDRWNPLVMNGALALAARQPKDPGFNFGKSGFSLKGAFLEFRKDLRWAAAGASVILALAAADVVVDYFADRARLDAVKKEISSQFAQCCPEVNSVVDPVSQMKAKIGEARKIAALSRGSGGQAGVLSVLKDISEKVPAGVNLKILNLSFEGDAVNLRAETDSFETADRIKGELGKSEYYRDVNISSSNLVKGGGRVEFELKITLAKKA